MPLVAALGDHLGTKKQSVSCKYLKDKKNSLKIRKLCVVPSKQLRLAIYSRKVSYRTSV